MYGGFDTCYDSASDDMYIFTHQINKLPSCQLVAGPKTVLDSGWDLNEIRAMNGRTQTGDLPGI